MIAPPPASGFRLVRYFTVASLAAFGLFAAALLYFARLEDDFHKKMQQEQNAFFAQGHDDFAKRYDAASHADLLRVHEAGNVNLTRLFANALWEQDFAPFVAKVQRIPVAQCRAIADVKDAGGKTVQPAEKKACYAGIGAKIMALPEFRALDAKVFDMMKKSTVFKIKVYDLRGITVYSSERNQIGEDKLGNAGWESAMAGKPASELAHRDKFSAFEGVVENRDLISSYLPVLAPGSEKIVGVFEVYSDVTSFLDQIRNTSTQIRKVSAENQAQVKRAVAANEARADDNANLLLAVVLGLLALLYCALFLIVRHGQRIIDKQDAERKQAEEASKQSHGQRQALIDSIDGIVWECDARTFQFAFVSQQAERLLGYPVERWISELTFWRDHIHPDDRDWAVSYCTVATREMKPHQIEYRFIAADGRSVWLSDIISVVVENGAAVKLRGLMVDITERKLQEQKIARFNRVHAVMSAINSLIVRVRDRQELFNESCRIAVEQGGFGIAWIGVLNQETLEITPAACAGVDAESLLAHSPNTARPDTPMGQGVVGRAIREKRAVFSNDITTEPGVGGERRKEAIRRGYRSAISLPLLVDGAAVGNLSLFAKEANFFTADEVKLLTELAGDISFALDHIGRQEKLDKLSRIRAVSGEINAAIVRIHERKALLEETCRIAVEHGKFELVWIALLDQEMQKVQPVAWAGFPPEIAHAVNWAATGAVGVTLAEAMLTRKIAMRNDIETEVRMMGVLRQEALKKGCHSTVCLPLVVNDVVVGAIILFAGGTNFFDKDELALLNEVAGNISFALQSMAHQERLNYLAYYDALTGLPNRALFDDRMAQHLRAASHEKNKTALVLIDLERFRAINDTLGRSAADDLLKLIAQRLQSVIFDRDSLARAQGGSFDRDSLARVQGNIFVGLFTAIKDEADIGRIVEEKIIGCLNQPFTIAGQEVRISAKIGVALFPGDATEPDALFSNAEAALRQAKESSDRYLFYARKMNAQVAERLKLENKLQRALERDEFVLFYQPKVDLNTGRVAGLEALLRWNDPDSGWVMPMLFIPLLEKAGMIVEVGAWAMKRAVSQYAAWQAAGLQPPRIAVNVSQVQLKRENFVTTVQQAIVIAGKPDHGLDLEITESMIMEDIVSSIEKLKTVRDLGVGIAIDDFGTGYSSLRYLTRLPITALKIDRAFIQHMSTNPSDMAIVSTIIALARNLNLKVIAEGVETEEQSKFLRLLKCDEIQGYLFSKPVPAEQVPALLARGGGKR